MTCPEYQNCPVIRMIIRVGESGLVDEALKTMYRLEQTHCKTERGYVECDFRKYKRVADECIDDD